MDGFNKIWETVGGHYIRSSALCLYSGTDLSNRGTWDTSVAKGNAWIEANEGNATATIEIPLLHYLLQTLRLFFKVT